MKIDMTSSAQCGSDALTTSMTDIGPHVQNILATFGRFNSYYLPSGSGGASYTLASSIKSDFLPELWGDGPTSTIIKRTGNFGDSFVIGGVSGLGTVAAGRVKIRDLAVLHGTPYTTGDTSLTNPVTSGAHFRIRGCQDFSVEGVYTSRLPYHYYFEGGSDIDIGDNISQNTIWDYTNISLQEGIAHIVFDKSATFGQPTCVKIHRTKFNGSLSPSRVVNYNGVNVTQSENIGAQNAILVYAMEDLSLMDTQIGSQAIGLNLNQKTGASILGVRSRNNYYDACRNQQVCISPQASGLTSALISFDGDQFNGESNGKNAIGVYNSFNQPVVYDLKVRGCQMYGHVATPFLGFAAQSGEFSGNTITAYNAVNASPTDGQWCAAGILAQQMANFMVRDNNVKGGNPYTYDGFVLIGPMTNVVEDNTKFLA